MLVSAVLSSSLVMDVVADADDAVDVVDDAEFVRLALAAASAAAARRRVIASAVACLTSALASMISGVHSLAFSIMAVSIARRLAAALIRVCCDWSNTCTMDTCDVATASDTSAHSADAPG